MEFKTKHNLAGLKSERVLYMETDSWTTFKWMVLDKWVNEVSTNLEQGQGHIEDDVQTLEQREE